LRGIDNVVGVKCGPSLGRDELLALAARLDPANRTGRLILIGRFGASRIGDRLPALMRATRAAGLNAVWMTDPMHGNTEQVGGRKVRRFDDVLDETAAFFAIAQAEGVYAGGMHLEMTPGDVTECLGGRGPASVGEMDRNYTSACDPRLNRDQAIDMARAVARRGAASEVPAG
jgi:3-deoxy-7-phosphoheptulonate synthase